jgi:hypothetical protein
MLKTSETRDFFTYAKKVRKKPKNSYGVRNSTNGTIHYYQNYYKDLERFVKSKRWHAFATFTFERRYKTAKMIYDHKVLKDFIPEVDKPFYEFPVWEPTLKNVQLYMYYLEKLLQEYSHKKWQLFWVIEEHKDGTPHVHAMVKNSRWGKGDIALLSNLWRFMRGGYVRIDEFKLKKGKDVTKSVNYVFKYVTKDKGNNWDWLYSEPGNNVRLKNPIDTYFAPRHINKIKARNMDLISSGSKAQRVELKSIKGGLKKSQENINMFKAEMYVV